jgi:hypothetical protein
MLRIMIIKMYQKTHKKVFSNLQKNSVLKKYLRGLSTVFEHFSVEISEPN